MISLNRIYINLGYSVRMDNRMLVSALLLLITSSCLAILGNHTLISAQETMPASTVATYIIETGTPIAFEDSAKVARDSALELIDEAIDRPLTESNTTETANVEFTDEFGGAKQNLTGVTATKDYVKDQLDNMIDGLENSTSLSFKMKIDTDCTASNIDCLFKIYLQK
jgi:hypothetical protein